jgi:transposase
VVSIDPYEAYRQAIQHELPRARIVVDHWMTPALDAPD